MLRNIALLAMCASGKKLASLLALEPLLVHVHSESAKCRGGRHQHLLGKNLPVTEHSRVVRRVSSALWTGCGGSSSRGERPKRRPGGIATRVGLRTLALCSGAAHLPTPVTAALTRSGRPRRPRRRRELGADFSRCAGRLFLALLPAREVLRGLFMDLAK